MPKVCIVDNYDSFTYNLYQVVSKVSSTNDISVTVVRNDAVELNFFSDIDGIIISPGPGDPDDAGISLDVVREFHSKIPILGVCLGHQVIAQAFGGKIIRARCPKHGKTSSIIHSGSGAFAGLPSPLKVARYHSLIVSEPGRESPVSITARSEEGEIMGIEVGSSSWGVQFHPESFMTECGEQMIKNFVYLLHD